MVDGYGAATFTYDYDEWMFIEVIVDLDIDWAQFLINGELIHEWQWSTGIGGSQVVGIPLKVVTSIHGIPIICKYFIDDFQLIQFYDN